RADRSDAPRVTHAELMLVRAVELHEVEIEANVVLLPHLLARCGAAPFWIADLDADVPLAAVEHDQKERRLALGLTDEDELIALLSQTDVDDAALPFRIAAYPCGREYLLL